MHSGIGNMRNDVAMWRSLLCSAGMSHFKTPPTSGALPPRKALEAAFVPALRHPHLANHSQPFSPSHPRTEVSFLLTEGESFTQGWQQMF